MSNPLGRPRDEELTAKVLKATYELLSKHHYHEISLVKVAEVAGVSRKALYSRWQNKIELVVEAFNFFNPPEMPDLQGSVKQQLLDYLEQSVAVSNQNPTLFGDILADILGSPQAQAFFDKAYTQPRWKIYSQILEKGVEQGEFSADMNIPLVVESLSAIFRSRILQQKTIEKSFINEVVTLLVR
ncbi:hypothetical protein A4G16_08065 [Mannheimia granulomatis]|uniref:HTH tetR-type domain-containing protein n=1 Tax=Mannheimia granulomatis TaxID=85402 RepID=A0A6G8JJJ8_9PAST|nr:TetR/AcrR family transcriptional regulator [Mannheimia granulomatis]QIM67327.1 hypothetical protein A4G16_08065 [Mannheimia granulomatis]